MSRVTWSSLLAACQRDLIYELQELCVPLERCLARCDGAGRNVQRCEQIESAITLVGALAASHDLAVVGLPIDPARPSAWMLGFSSTLITSAFSGGFKYLAIISAAFAANCWLVLTHHERWRCKQAPSLRITRQTAYTEPLTLLDRPTPPDDSQTSPLTSVKTPHRLAWEV